MNQVISFVFFKRLLVNDFRSTLRYHETLILSEHDIGDELKCPKLLGYVADVQFLINFLQRLFIQVILDPILWRPLYVSSEKAFESVK